MIMKYEERLAQAKALYAIPPKENQPGQKFLRGQRVKIADEMPPSMKHFFAGVEAIVEYTYAQKYRSNNIDDYSLLLLQKNGEPRSSVAWYHENQLTLVCSDRKKGMELIERYEAN